MTKMEAFKAGVEFGYTNDNLFNKILIDAGVTSSDTYAASNKSEIDLCLVDLYEYLASHPDVQDGQSRIHFDPAHLRACAKRLLDRYPDLSTTTLLSKGWGKPVSGESIW